MIAPCPLCGSARAKDAAGVSYVSYGVLRKIYRRKFRIEIQPSESTDLACVTCQSCGLIYFSPMVIGEPSLYEQLQRFPWYYMANKPEFQVARSFTKSGDTVLEIGCGAGSFAAHLQDSVNYRGLEFNDEAVRRATVKGLKVTNQSLLDYRENTKDQVDLVCAFQVLEHVADPHQFIFDMLEVLKPGGFMVISVPSEDSLMRYELNNVLNAPPHHQTRWTDATLARAADIFGIELVDIRHESPPDALNVPGFAMADLLRWLRARLGIKLPRFSLVADTLPVRGFLGVASLLFRARLRAPDSLEFGHTVTAVYRKGTS